MARYGWKPDRFDSRDRHAVAKKLRHSKPPPDVSDMRPCMPDVYDQGNIGSCTGQTIGGACHYLELVEHKLTADRPSRLFIYYNERLLEGTVDEDAGAELRTGLKTLNLYGYPDETLWPYSDDPFRYKQRPTASVYAAARRNRVVDYAKVTQTPIEVETCLASGYPIMFGFDVFKAFESDAMAQGKPLTMPKRGETPLGGHAVLAVGYNRINQLIYCRNSWGESWGVKGYFGMPYKYMFSKYASDFWIVRDVE